MLYGTNQKTHWYTKSLPRLTSTNQSGFFCMYIWESLWWNPIFIDHSFNLKLHDFVYYCGTLSSCESRNSCVILEYYFYYFLNIFLICGSKIMVIQKYYQEVSNLDDGRRSAQVSLGSVPAHVDYKVVTAMKMTIHSQKLDQSIKFTEWIYTYTKRKIIKDLVTNLQLTLR